LSRSTQESGLSRKKEEKELKSNYKLRATEKTGNDVSRASSKTIFA
jgi:hypothetical protein